MIKFDISTLFDHQFPNHPCLAKFPRLWNRYVAPIELWKLKGTTAYKDKLFDIHDDMANTALDAI